MQSGNHGGNFLCDEWHVVDVFGDGFCYRSKTAMDERIDDTCNTPNRRLDDGRFVRNRWSKISCARNGTLVRSVEDEGETKEARYNLLLLF